MQLIAQAYLSQYLESLLLIVSFTSCFGTMEQVRATDGTLNTLNFNERKNIVKWTSYTNNEK